MIECVCCCSLIKHPPLAFPFGESGFCERSEQKTREVSHPKNVTTIHISRVTDLYRLDFHFIPSSHFPSAADAPSPSDFVCHLRLCGGRAPFVALRHFPRFIGDIYPFHRESLPQRGKQERLRLCPFGLLPAVFCCLLF